jgi:hypothetical protein
MKIRRIELRLHEERSGARVNGRRGVGLWCARLAWALLPVSVGAALSDALDSWSTAPARVATVLLWSAWALGLISLLAPRSWGLTCLRVLAPAAVAVGVLAAFGTSGALAVSAVVSSLVAAAFALSSSVACAAANADAYGDEERFPLRIPPSLFLAPVPVAVALTAAGVAAGPLLLADGRLVAGIAAVVIGIPLAFVLVRSLHSLSRRWLVLVPAGVVVADPLTLADPVLMRRENIEMVDRASRTLRGQALDLRLGSPAGTICIALVAAQSFARRRGRHTLALQDADTVLVSAVQAAAFMRDAGARRIATA